MPRSAFAAPAPYGGTAIVEVATGAGDTDRILRRADPEHHVFYAWKDDTGWHALVRHQLTEVVHGRKNMRKLARGFATYFNIPDIAERWIRNGALAELAIVVWIQESNDQHKEKHDV